MVSPWRVLTGSVLSCSTGPARPEARHHLLQYLGEDHLLFIGQITDHRSQPEEVGRDGNSRV